MHPLSFNRDTQEEIREDTSISKKHIFEGLFRVLRHAKWHEWGVCASLMNVWCSETVVSGRPLCGGVVGNKKGPVLGIAGVLARLTHCAVISGHTRIV